MLRKVWNSLTVTGKVVIVLLVVEATAVLGLYIWYAVAVP